MKFYGEPGMLVSERVRKPFTMEYKMKPRFRFDENGEFETDDERLIKKLKTKFKYDEGFKCKKCGKTFENKGYLMAHYRKEH